MPKNPMINEGDDGKPSIPNAMDRSENGPSLTDKKHYDNDLGAGLNSGKKISDNIKKL